MDDILGIATKQRNEAAQRIIKKVLASGDGEMLNDVKTMMDLTDTILEALVDRVDRAKRLKQLEDILWKCRHGGKGGVPVDYQEEVDRLLATYQGGEGR